MIRIFAIGCGLAALIACSSAIKTVDQVNDPSDDVALKNCREEGRAAREAGADKDAAYGVYFDCTKEAGLR